MKTRIIKTKTAEDIKSAAAEGAAAIKAGKLVGFATETVYGIAALASDSGAMERLRELKSRPSRPFSLHIGRAVDVYRYVHQIPRAARRLITKAWPGPITVLLPTGGKLADEKFQRDGLYDVLCSGGMIGVRCPDHPLASAMLSAVDGPVVAPSANPAGTASPHTAKQVLDKLDGQIDILIDSGQTQYAKDSTIVKFDENGWEIVRRGVYSVGDIKKFTDLCVLFVCTGNTCRSPIAEGLARKILAERFSCRPAQLAEKGIQIISAGLFAIEGQRVTPEAVSAVKELGGDISHHRSRKLTEELISSADLIFCMTAGHVRQVVEMAPASAAKVFQLDNENDINDPIGGSGAVYVETARHIEKALKLVLEKVEL